MKPVIHGKDHEPGHADPIGPFDSTATAGTSWGTRSAGPQPAGNVLKADGAGGSSWGPPGGSGPPFIVPGSGGAPTFVLQDTIIDDTKYNAFPWLCVSKFGVLFAVYREGSTHASIDGKITIQKSTDGGATWGAKIYLESPAAGHDLRDPSMVTTRTGRMIVNYFDGTVSDTQFTIYTIYSDNGGTTWSSPAALSPYTGNFSATSGAILQHSSGQLIMAVYGRDTGDTADRNGVLISNDDGITWSSRVDITAANDMYNEMTMVELADGSILGFVRREVNPGPMYKVESTDIGSSWTSPVSLGWNVIPGRPAAVIVPATQAIILMYRFHTLGKAYYVWSFDNGVTWSTETPFSNSQMQYMGGVALTPYTIAFAVALEIGSTNCDIFFAEMTTSSVLPVSAPAAAAKGDMIAASGPNAWGTIAVGSDGKVLTADTASLDGVKWANAPVTSALARTGAVVAVDADYYGVVAAAKTGATQASQYIGATSSGAPASGTHAVGDWIIDRSGAIYICTTGGTPGTWTQVGGAGAVSSVFGRTGAVVAATGDYYGAVAAALTGATSASRYAGATTSGSPGSGTFATGDFVIAQNGHLFICTAGGTPGTWVDAGTAGSLASPLTTKGDVWGYSTVNARVPVGSDGQVLTADSAQTLGVKWAAASGTGITVLDLVERSTDLVVTAASAAAAQDWIVGNAVAYSGSQRIMIEAYCPVANATAANELILNLWDGSTDLGRLGIFDSTNPVTVAATLTPSAATHTYKVKAWKGSGSGRQFSAGASSASGPLVNAFYRITAS